MTENMGHRAAISSGLALVLTFALMMATMAIVSADNPNTFTTQGGSVAFDDVTVSFPQNTASGDVTVTYTALTGDAIPGSAPSGTMFGSQAFSLAADPSKAFSRLVDITVKFNDADLSSVGGDANKVKLYIYDAGFKSWMENAAAIRDTANKTLTTQQSTLGTYALVDVGAVAPEPPAPAPVEPPASVGDWSPGSSLLLGLLAVGFTMILSGYYLLIWKPRNAISL